MSRLPPALEYVLRDNSRALLRWVREGDIPRFRAGFEQLSDTARFSRFFDHLNRLSEAQLRYFTQIDYVNHMAWGALDLDRPSVPGLGVARYVRLPKQPEDAGKVADLAVTIADAAQGSGLGTALMACLHCSASESGFAAFSCDVLDSNRAFADRLERLGATVTGHDDGIISLRWPVAQTPSDVPGQSTSAERFRTVLAQLQSAELFRGAHPVD